MPTSSVKLDAVGRLGTVVILKVNVSSETIMRYKICLRTQIIWGSKAISKVQVGFPVRQDVLTSGYHLRRVSKLLAVENERTAVFVESMLRVVAHVHSGVNLFICLIVVLLSDNQVLINVILVRTDSF